MDINISYPTTPHKRVQRHKLLTILKWPILAAAVICPLVNYFTGGKAWSLVVLMGLYSTWRLVLATDLVEYNRLSQTIKVVIHSCILLAVIDYFLARGYLIRIVPIVAFSGLAISGALLFSDLQRQKQNLLPLLFLIQLSLLGSGIGLSFWHDESCWPLIVLGGLALLLLIACCVTLGADFLRELKRRFHVK